MACICKKPWSGPLCDQNICHGEKARSCNNNGYCEASGAFNTKCICNDGYSGDDCEISCDNVCPGSFPYGCASGMAGEGVHLKCNSGGGCAYDTQPAANGWCTYKITTSSTLDGSSACISKNDCRYDSGWNCSTGNCTGSVYKADGTPCNSKSFGICLNGNCVGQTFRNFMNLTIATPASPNTMTTTTASHSIVTTLSPSLDGTTTSPPLNVMTTVAPSIDEGPLRMDIALDADFANITFSADVTKEDIWFGVGFHANKMADFPYAIIIFGDGTVAERKLGNHVQGTLLTSMITVVSNSVNNNGRRIVVMKRARTGLTSDHYTFTNEETIDCIYAIGNTKAFAYHKNFGVNMKVEVTVSTSAYIIKGNGESDLECLTKTKTETSNPPSNQNTDITVSCCGTSNSNLIRKDSTGACYPRGKTYEAASAICSTSGGRICTKAELVGGIVRGKGCNGDNFMTWTSDTCSDEGIATQPPTTPPPPPPLPNISFANNWVVPTNGEKPPLIVGNKLVITGTSTRYRYAKLFVDNMPSEIGGTNNLYFLT